MKKLNKCLWVICVTIFIVISAVSCAGKKLTFQQGFEAFDRVQSKAAENSYLAENHNYSVERNTDIYFDDVKRFLPLTVHLNSFSYYKSGDDSTLTVFSSQKLCDSIRNYAYTSSRYTYGYSSPLDDFYMFHETTYREKNGADSSQFKKEKIGDFDTQTSLLLKSYYYYDVALEFFAILTGSQTLSPLNIDQLTGAKFTKKGDGYILRLNKNEQLESGKITKAFLLEFDENNINFVEIITKTYDNTEKMVKLVWNKLTVKYQSGRAEMPKDPDSFTDM